MMWFEPLAEVGTLLMGCAAMLGATAHHFKKSYDADFCLHPREISGGTA